VIVLFAFPVGLLALALKEKQRIVIAIEPRGPKRPS